MKKILIATTALVATASVAAAEVRLSGYARFGMQYTEGTAAVAATQGVHTAASAAIVGGGVAEGDAVTAAHSAALVANLTAANAAAAAAAHAQDGTAAATATAAAAAAAAVAASAGTAATAAVANSTGVVSRARIQADASTTTDAGIGLSYRQRFQTEENRTGGLNGARFGVSYEGVMIQMGNICGVIECTPGLYMATNSAGIGLEGQSWSSLAANNAGGAFNWTAYSSGGAGATDGIEVMYSANGLGLHVHSTDGSTGFGASYKISNISLAAARETFDAGNEITLVTAGLDLGNGGLGVAWAENNAVTKTVIKADYDMAPGANIHAFIGSEDAGESYGVGVNYGLGGGASFDAGVDADAAGRTRISGGLFFKF